MTTDAKTNDAAGAAGEAAAAAKEAAAAAANGKGAEAGDGSDGDAPVIYRPEGLPDHYAGESDQDTIDKLFTAVNGFREGLAKKGVPAKPEEYTLDLPDDIKAAVIKPDENGVDPVLSRMQGIFHKHGIPNAAFNDIVGDVYKAVAEINAAQQEGGEGGNNAFQADFEFKDMGGTEKIKPVMDGVNAWMTGLQAAGKLDDSDVQELSLMALHSAGLKALTKLREMAGEKPIPLNMGGGADSGEQMTEEKLNARIADPRYNRKSPEYDEAFVKETTEMFAAFYNKPKVT